MSSFWFVELDVVSSLSSSQLKFVIRYLQHVIGVFGDRFYRLNLKEKRILVEFETTYVVGKEKVLKGFWGF